MPRFRFKHHGDCVVGAIDIEVPGAPGKLTLAAVGDDRADALGKAALIAERIASDPVMRALMPPQALVAIKAAKGLSAAARRGSHVLRHFWGKLRGPGKKRLAAVLHTEAQEREQDASSQVSGWPYAMHVHPLGDVVGLRNPFRRKKKKRAAQRRTAPPRDPRADVDDGQGDEQYADEQADEQYADDQQYTGDIEGDDLGDDDMGDVEGDDIGDSEEG